MALIHPMNTLVHDLRYALRALAKNKGFTLAAVLSLAIGIGANTSIFSVANALLLHPLPYQDADRLAILWNRSPGLTSPKTGFLRRSISISRPGSRASNRSPSLSEETPT